MMVIRLSRTFNQEHIAKFSSYALTVTSSNLCFTVGHPSEMANK